MRDDGSYIGFIGVRTGGSSINRIFPRWADHLGLPTRTLVGHDIPLGSPAQAYRQVVNDIKNDPRHRGALITTHKIDVYAAARGLFDHLDPLASEFGEISSIYKRSGGLCGAARDPLTAGLALDEFLLTDHFRQVAEGEVLCLGSGGAGTALTHHLGHRADPPARITCTARQPSQLERLRDVHIKAGLEPSRFRYEITDTPRKADALLYGLPPGSVVVNATGLGKDRPGSPVTDSALFPERGFAWELNYRGSLEFLTQARMQQAARQLTVEDGWRYFIHGWSQVVADIFGLPMTRDLVADLSDVAARAQ